MYGRGIQARVKLSVEKMIYIIRHGKTELNKSKVLQGRSNYPLTGEGVRQAEEAAARLGDVTFAHVFSSPLIRAVQTAEIIAPQIKPVIDERLIEMDYGPYEGTDMTHLPPELLTFFSDFIHNPAPEGMEQLTSVIGRAGAFLEDYQAASGKHLDFNACNCDERSAGISDS